MKVMRAAWRAQNARNICALATVAAAEIIMLLLFPDDLAFLTRVAATAIFVLSLDMVLGYAGIATIGHAVLFGSGAYAAGWVCRNVGADPVLLLAIGLLVGAVAGLIQGAIISSAVGLAQVVLSIATVELAHALANQMVFVTGGSDGLAGIAPNPLFGSFEFDLWGQTAYGLSAATLVISLAFAQRVTQSPFGMLCLGIKADPTRVKAMGSRVYPHLLKMYVLSGGLAGVAGALTAMSAGVVGLNSISFDSSAKALVMLILGGAGTLYGALLGTILFMVIEQLLSALNPYNWITFIGVLLVLTVVFVPHGLGSLVSQLPHLLWMRRPAGHLEIDAPPSKIAQKDNV